MTDDCPCCPKLCPSFGFDKDWNYFMPDEDNCNCASCVSKRNTRRKEEIYQKRRESVKKVIRREPALLARRKEEIKQRKLSRPAEERERRSETSTRYAKARRIPQASNPDTKLMAEIAYENSRLNQFNLTTEPVQPVYEKPKRVSKADDRNSQSEILKPDEHEQPSQSQPISLISVGEERVEQLEQLPEKASTPDEVPIIAAPETENNPENLPIEKRSITDWLTDEKSMIPGVMQLQPLRIQPKSVTKPTDLKRLKRLQQSPQEDNEDKSDNNIGDTEKEDKEKLKLKKLEDEKRTGSARQTNISYIKSILKADMDDEDFPKIHMKKAHIEPNEPAAAAAAKSPKALEFTASSQSSAGTTENTLMNTNTENTVVENVNSSEEAEAEKANSPDILVNALEEKVVFADSSKTTSSSVSAHPSSQDDEVKNYHSTEEANLSSVENYVNLFNKHSFDEINFLGPQKKSEGGDRLSTIHHVGAPGSSVPQNIGDRPSVVVKEVKEPRSQCDTTTTYTECDNEFVSGSFTMDTDWGGDGSTYNQEDKTGAGAPQETVTETAPAPATH